MYFIEHHKRGSSGAFRLSITNRPNYTSANATCQRLLNVRLEGVQGIQFVYVIWGVHMKIRMRRCIQPRISTIFLKRERELFSAIVESIAAKVVRFEHCHKIRVSGFSPAFVWTIARSNVFQDFNHCFRSEERRVGKESRSRWSPYH